MPVQLAYTKAMAGSNGYLFFLIDGLVVRVNTKTGAVAKEKPPFGHVPLGYRAGAMMTAMDTGLYMIYPKSNAELHRLDLALVGQGTGPINDWPTPRMIAADGGSVFVIDHSTLWRVDPATLANNGSGPPNDWPNPRMMAAVNGQLFVVEGHELWRVDPATLANNGRGPANDWPNPRTIAAANGKLYVIDGTQLWRVDVNTLANDGFGPPGDWPNPVGMASDGKALFVLDGDGKLWQVDETTLTKGPQILVVD